MFDKCEGCEATEGFVFWRSSGTGENVVLCRDCHKGTGPGVKDVWYGYGSGTHTEQNIAYPKGHPQQGQPIPFSSRKGKWEAMKIAGIKEAGDRNHGGRPDETRRKTYI